MSTSTFTGDNVRAYLCEIGRVPLLSDEEEITLGRKVQMMMELEETRKSLEKELDRKVDDRELCDHVGAEWKKMRRTIREGKRAKDKMVTANLRLVVSVARKYTKRNMELLDIIQEGTIGLVRGVEKFDPTRGYKFSTYAYWWIRQGITRAIAEKSRAIRLPIHITENLNKLKRVQREVSQETGSLPSLDVLSERLEMSIDDVKDLMCKARHPTSLEVKIGENRDTTLIDLLEDEATIPDMLLERQHIKESVVDAVSKLPEMQAAVLEMRYGIGPNQYEAMSMTAIGQVLNMSRDRVRTLEMKGMRALQEECGGIECYL